MPTPDQVRAAINALNRVRAVEKPAEADGTREVWHQASTDVDLLSVVNAEGILSQQQLSLFADVIHWSRRGGLRTGRATDPSGHEPISGDGTIFDPMLLPDRLKRAHEALASYQGADNYLVHFRDLLAATLEGRTWTEARIISKLGVSQPVARSAAPGRLWIAVGAVVLITGAVAWWLAK